MQSDLNIYVCSTVRHLLFALLRATKHADQLHELIFFTDYQQVELSEWQLGNLPDNIRLHEVTRTSLRRHLNSSLVGRLISFLAMRNLAVPAALCSPIHSWMLEHTDIGQEQFSTEPRLWLFNERNKMSRIFRLLVRQFALIEDGEGNYQLLDSPWWRWPLRLLLGRTIKYRVFGEDRRCTEIWAVHPERLPPPVVAKGRQIDFLAGKNARDLIRSLFALDSVGMQNFDVILATQPIDMLPGVTIAQKQQIYAQIVRHLNDLEYKVLLKVHPAENKADYEHLADTTGAAPGKFPLEALILGAENRIPVISIVSTAGMGFEQYCRRIQLCRNTHERVVPAWADNQNTLENVLNKHLTTAILC